MKKILQIATLLLILFTFSGPTSQTSGDDYPPPNPKSIELHVDFNGTFL